jgi:hypothetical protein
MWIRNYEGKLVYFDITKYHNETDLYIKLWKIKFNINLNEEQVDFNNELMQLIIS